MINLEGRARLQKYLRAALLIQAAGMLATIALTVPDWIDARLHQLECGWCFDFRGAAFSVSLIVLGPTIVALLLVAWRWRGSHLWPLVIVAAIDALAIFWGTGITISLVFRGTDLVPPAASAAPLLLLPALATLVLALGPNLERALPWRRILAVSAAISLLPIAGQGLGVVGPAHQSTPGELSLPFSRTAAYEARDLGCQDWVQGWVDMHKCMSATLFVYRGSGDVSRDMASINQALAAHDQTVELGGLVSALPVEGGINRTDNRKVDASNAGACLIITDRLTTPTSSPKPGRCALVTDYADIRSHWPANDAYAIGIVYFWERRDYRDQYSVTFTNMSSAEPGGRVIVAVRARPNTLCSIVAVDSSGLSTVQGLDPKTTDAAGNVGWSWSVDTGATAGRWPITVTCGATSGRTDWAILVFGK
jgi:hypothetical protein